jgi:hypothetical protein
VKQLTAFATYKSDNLTAAIEELFMLGLNEAQISVFNGMTNSLMVLGVAVSEQQNVLISVDASDLAQLALVTEAFQKTGAANISQLES